MASSRSSSTSAGRLARARGRSMRLMKSQNSASGPSWRCARSGRCGRRERRLEQARRAGAGGGLAELFQRGGADAALGRGDGADEGRVVVAVGDQAQVGSHVLDLGACRKTTGRPTADRASSRCAALARTRAPDGCRDRGWRSRQSACGAGTCAPAGASPPIRLRARRPAPASPGWRRPGRARSTAASRTAWGCWR